MKYKIVFFNIAILNIICSIHAAENIPNAKKTLFTMIVNSKRRFSFNSKESPLLSAETVKSIFNNQGNPQWPLIEYYIKNKENQKQLVNVTNDKQQTLLMFAAADGNKNVVETLLLNGAKVDEIDKDGKTALWYLQKVSPHSKILTKEAEQIKKIFLKKGKWH